MKTISTRTCMLVILMAAMTNVAMAADRVSVGTAAELRAALKANNDIQLTADIDLTGWETINTDEEKYIYTGTVDGEYHADGASSESHPFCYALMNGSQAILEKASGATFKNIALLDFDIDRNLDCLGILTREATNCHYENLVITNCKVDGGALLDWFTGNQVGMVVGHAVGCSFTGIAVGGCQVACDGIQVGSIVGLAEQCDFEKCFVNLSTSVYADGGGVNAYAGGLCGESEGGSFIDCYSLATVGANDDRVGGIVGFSTGTTFLRCYNSGYVCICEEKDDFDKVMGVIGGSLAGIAAKFIVNEMNYRLLVGLGTHFWNYFMRNNPVTAYIVTTTMYTSSLLVSVVAVAVVGVIIYNSQDSDEVGGIAGATCGGTFTQCANLGVIQSADAYAGGIVGWARINGNEMPYIHSCMNQGYVFGREQAGGIVGCIECGIVKGCLNVGQTNLMDLEEMADNEGDWGEIWGEMGSDAQAMGNVTISKTTDAADGRACRGMSYIDLNSGLAARYLNDYTLSGTVWRQKINTDAYPTPIFEASDDAAIVTDAAMAAFDGGPVYIEVSSAFELFYAVANPFCAIVLTDDINLGVSNPFVSNGGTFGQFGNRMRPFRGILEGMNHELYGMNIQNDELEQLGLFDYAQGATFRNFTLRDITLRANDNVGALVAESKNCDYSNVHLYGTVNLHTDDDNLGGLVGNSYHDTFASCSAYMNGTFQCDNENAGGICGKSECSTFTELSVKFAGNQSQSFRIYAGDYTAGGITGFSRQDSFTDCRTDGCLIFSDGDGTDAYAGGIAGQADHSTFVSCTNRSEVVGHDNYVGGIAGTALICRFDHCANRGYVHHYYETGTDDYLGGICGRSDGSVFESCANYGALTCGDEYCGGICGYSDDEDADGKTILTTFHNCLNAGPITSDDYLGGICGSLNDSQVSFCLNVGIIQGGNEDSDKGPVIGGKDSGCTISDCYYLTGMTYVQDNPQAIPVGQSDMASGIIGWWLNKGAADGVWRQAIGELPGYPSPDPEVEALNPHRIICTRSISTADDLMAFAAQVNCGMASSLLIELTADIDLSGKQWIPIGTSEHPFMGIFLGHGHTVSHLSCSYDQPGAGFFGTLNSRAGIYGVNLDMTCTISSSSYGVGGIAGRVSPAIDVDNGNSYAVIDGCISQASLSGEYNVAGILGNVSNTSESTRLVISNCGYEGLSFTANGRNKGETGESALICGYAGKHATIENCFGMAALFSVDDFDAGQSFVRAGDGGAVIRNCYQYADMVSTYPDLAQEGVGTFTSDDINDGMLVYALNGSTNNPAKGLRWEENIYNGALTQPRVVPQGADCKGVYYTRNVTSTLGTIVLPFDAVSDDNVTFYTLTDASDAGSLNFESIDVLPAGTPAVFRVAETGTISFLGSGNSFSYTAHDVEQVGWTMKGYFGASDESLVFTSGKDDMSRLYYISGGLVKNATRSLTIAPLRAYLEGPSFSGAKSVMIRLDGINATSIDWTGVDETTGDANTGTGFIYDLQGRSLDNLQHGINIIGGKKTMVR